MRIAIVGNADARGLEKDRKLISPIIESVGHSVFFIQYDKPHEEHYDLLIFLEVVPRNLIKLSEAAPWLIPNPEFLNPDSVRMVRRSFGRVLCKTHEAHRLCKQLFGDKAGYVGFLSEDKLDKTVVKTPRMILHVAGQSRAKNTIAVIDAWRWDRHGEELVAQLVVVSDWPVENLPKNVSIVSGITDEQLRELQNTCQIHLQPSATEGWSHAIHEAMSVNASILTVDAAPMNETHATYKIPSTGSTQFNSSRMHEVSAIDIHCAVQDMLRLGKNGFAATGMPRREFLDGNQAFRKAFTEELASLQPIPGWKLPSRHDNKCVAFIGNFVDEHSTENQILWALEQGLGYEVEKLQENAVGLEQIKDACDYSGILMWVRTPTWLKVSDEEMFWLLQDLQRRGLKTCSLHLDKFWGIPERESLIGKIPFWKTQYVFTADGSRQEDFAKRGVNHFWMKPAVSEVYCHPGTPREEYRCDVGFVGAKNYHGEYPFRQELVEFLEQTYGDRFKHIQGVRGHLLNDVYASMKIVVGDCFQAGTPFYWSDRLPETCGRHGFLLHPKVEGFLFEEVATYRPQNRQDLQEKIEWWLGRDSERRHLAWCCADGTLKRDTWTLRMHEVLEVVCGTKEHATSVS